MNRHFTMLFGRVAALLTLALASTDRLHAEGEPKLPTPPPAPFLQNAPMYAAWTVELERRGAQNAPPSGDGTPASRAVLKKLEITKYGADRHEVSEWSDGKRSERWFYRGLHLVEQRDGPDLYVMPASEDGFTREAFPDYRENDFPELQWVSLASFARVESLKGKPFYLYERKSARGEAVVAGASAKAGKGAGPGMRVWIDADSRLPVVVDDGMTVKVYAFRRVAMRPPELSPRFQKVFENYQAMKAEPEKHRMNFQ